MVQAIQILDEVCLLYILDFSRQISLQSQTRRLIGKTLSPTNTLLSLFLVFISRALIYIWIQQSTVDSTVQMSKDKGLVPWILAISLLARTISYGGKNRGKQSSKARAFHTIISPKLYVMIMNANEIICFWKLCLVKDWSCWFQKKYLTFHTVDTTLTLTRVKWWIPI